MRKEPSLRILPILTKVAAAVSLAAWAFEESISLIPTLAPYASWGSMAGLALDLLTLGIGLTLLFHAAADRGERSLSPWPELVSSFPVILLASAPLVFGILQNRPEVLPGFLLAARSIRILRLRRLFPASPVSLLVAVAVLGTLRIAAEPLLRDAGQHSSALRLLLLPEALVLLAAVGMRRAGPQVRPPVGNPCGGDARGETPLIGEEELTGLLGKKGTW
ncbi:MAG TPA: hypothetical protein VLH39_01645 [Magnetospirillaceae bacterium]|nr:hypothetical protein [Magnetospirillaceae bacterium]